MINVRGLSGSVLLHASQKVLDNDKIRIFMKNNLNVSYSECSESGGELHVLVAVSSEPAQLQRHALALGQVQVEGGLCQRHTLVLQHALDAGHVTPAADQLQLRRLHSLKQFDWVGDGGGRGDEADQDEGQHDDDDDLGVSEMTD